jgi:hypothetical protein
VPEGGSEHYKQAEIEPIEFIEALGLDFHLGNVVKYVARVRYTRDPGDIDQAVWYLKRWKEVYLASPSAPERRTR